MYFILFLLFSVANSSSAFNRQSGPYVVACVYLEDIGNWMLRLTEPVDGLCKDYKTNEKEVADVIKNGYKKHFQKIDNYNSDLSMSSYIDRMGSSLRENDKVTTEAILDLDKKWQGLRGDVREKIQKYFQEIIDEGTSRLDIALTYRMMRILPASNNDVEKKGFLRTVTKNLTNGYKSVIADPLFNTTSSPRVIIIHNIITLSNILENPDLKHEDYEKITFLFNEFKSLPVRDLDDTFHRTSIQLLDLLDDVWKKLSGESVPPLTKGKVNYISDVGQAWNKQVEATIYLWNVTQGGAHPPCEDIVKEHFGDKLKELSPDIDWMRSLKLTDARKDKFREKGRLYYFLNRLLYPSKGWKPRIIINSQPAL